MMGSPYLSYRANGRIFKSKRIQFVVKEKKKKRHFHLFTKNCKKVILFDVF